MLIGDVLKSRGRPDLAFVCNKLDWIDVGSGGLAEVSWLLSGTYKVSVSESGWRSLDRLIDDEIVKNSARGAT